MKKYSCCINSSCRSVAASSGYHSFAILSEESEDLDALFPERNTSRANNLNSSVSSESFSFKKECKFK